MSRADDVIVWIEEYCRIPEGPDVAGKVKLADGTPLCQA